MSQRAFLPPAPAAPEVGAVVELDVDESHYLTKVRRLQIGASFEALDGLGHAWRSTVVQRVGKRLRVEIGALLPAPEVPERLLILGMPDAPATLEALTGASEAGATEIVLVRCQRSQGRSPSPSRVERVLRAAQRQCGRRLPPRLHGLGRPWELGQALALHPEWPAHFAWALRRGDTTALGDTAALGDTTVLGGASSASSSRSAEGRRLLVGPEGGLTDGEVTTIQAAGFAPLSLGPWVQRTPTAVVAGLARLHP